MSFFRRLCSHNKLYKGNEQDVTDIFIRRGFSEIELIQCPKFNDAYEVWAKGDTWAKQESTIVLNQDNELKDQPNKTKQDEIRTKYNKLLYELKHKKDSLNNSNK
jgi:hypothetical protein